jgi:hypothetical protein
MRMSEQITMLLRTISIVDMFVSFNIDDEHGSYNQSQTTIDILDIEHVHDRTSK